MRILIFLAFLASDDLCKAQANWALMLLKDFETGFPIVNVMPLPEDERVLQMVREHQGTRIELYYKVLNDCRGTKT